MFTAGNDTQSPSSSVLTNNYNTQSRVKLKADVKAEFPERYMQENDLHSL